MTWVIESERTPGTFKHLEALKRGEALAIVPAIWPEEITNVFLTVERARKLTSGQVADWLYAFQNIPIQIEPPLLEESFGAVRILAQTHGLTAYDARYLHLAMRDSVVLATRDKRLLAVAPRVGVKLIHT
jgi:predicted nucleic acid-binding protein